MIKSPPYLWKLRSPSPSRILSEWSVCQCTIFVLISVETSKSIRPKWNLRVHPLQHYRRCLPETSAYRSLHLSSALTSEPAVCSRPSNRVYSRLCWKPTLAMPLQVVMQGGGPWGFRLVGGKDFEQPLTISRVSFIVSSCLNSCLPTPGQVQEKVPPLFIETRQSGWN